MNRSLLVAPLARSARRCLFDDNPPPQMHGTLERDRLELVAESHERIVDVLVREADRVAVGAVLCGTRPAYAAAPRPAARCAG